VLPPPPCGWRRANRVSQPFNLVISNLPGPRQPLYFAGAKLSDQFPVSIVTDGQALNITVVSYLDRLDFRFIADRELVPDVWNLADMHVAEISRLFEATGADWAQPPQPALPRRGRSVSSRRAIKSTVKEPLSARPGLRHDAGWRSPVSGRVSRRMESLPARSPAPVVRPLSAAPPRRPALQGPAPRCCRTYRCSSSASLPVFSPLKMRASMLGNMVMSPGTVSSMLVSRPSTSHCDISAIASG
jgi:hypothetical protein